MLAKAAALDPHLTIKVVDGTQRSKGSANSQGNLLTAAGLAKEVSLSCITISCWRVRHSTACFGGEACDGVSPKGFLYKAPAQHSDKQLVSEGSVSF